MSAIRTPSELIQQLNLGPVAFSEVIATIEAHYHFTPTAFSNGQQTNEAGQNNTQDVLGHPDATDHQNIRQFMQHGWAGIRFNGEALQAKT
jgi:hypothetical protein